MRVRLLPVILMPLAVVLVTLAAASWTAGRAAAAAPAPPGATVTTAPLPTVEGRPATECISANPRPDCYESREFERSGRGHLLLFGVLALALAAIAVVVVRSTARRDRSRVAGPPGGYGP